MNCSRRDSAKGVAAILGGGVAAMPYQPFGSWSAPFYGSAALALIAAVSALRAAFGAAASKGRQRPRAREGPGPLESWYAGTTSQPVKTHDG